MKLIRYSPDAADKLRDMKREITERHGADVSQKVIKAITGAINELSEFETKGPAVSDLFGVDTEYRFLYKNKNYIFYRVDKNYIRIVNIYNEKEDFMWKLFGIDTTPEETTGFWDD